MEKDNDKRSFLDKVFAKTFGSAPVQAAPRPAPTQQEIIGEKYNSFNPELRKMIDAMAYRESVNGKVRVKPGDQKDKTSSYGLLHMGQGAVDEFLKRKQEFGYTGPNFKAKDLQNPESDYLQKFIQASRIKRDMDVNKRDLFSATRYIQNFGEPNYATTTMKNFNKAFPSGL